MVFMGGNGGCMVVDADGTRHGYTGSSSIYSYGNYYSNSFTGRTSDGSFIDYNCYYSSGTYGTYLSGSARLPNGTTVYYSSPTGTYDQIFPTQITDAQGNYVTISYVNNQGPNLQTVTDTMNRTISFHYDGANRLVSVTAPRLDNSGTRTVVRLHYNQIGLGYNFGGMYVDTPTSTPVVLDAIYYPGTNTGYWFGDGDSYSSYGMIAKAMEMRGMSWSGSGNNDQGSISMGTMTKQASYHYLTSGTLSDAPTYDYLDESWAGMTTSPARTTYSFNNNDTHSDGFSQSPAYTTIVTQPNGLVSKQYAYRTPGAWMDGLIFADETAANNATVSSSIVSWQQGDYGSARPAFMIVTDERGHTTKTELGYGPYNQLINKKEFDYNNGPLLRETRTEYENNGAYTGRHIFNLVKANEIWDGNGNRIGRTEYEYDNNALYTGTGNHNLKATPGVVMHNYASDPYTTVTHDGNCISGQFNYPQCSYEGEYVWVWQAGGYEDICHYECYQYEQVSSYDPNSIFRGNVTKVTSYSEAANPNLATAAVNIMQYDVTGNLVAESASCCEQKTYDYNINTQYAYPTSATSGSANDPNVRNTTHAAYDYNTGLVRTTTDANNRTDTTYYDAETLRPSGSASSTGAYTIIGYYDASMGIIRELHEANGNLAENTITDLNGLGQVTRLATRGANNQWDIASTEYDNMGRMKKQTKPYLNGSPNVYWTEIEYDALGRTKKVTEPDGSYSQAFYNEATGANGSTGLPGDTVRSVDAWGRERWVRNDALDRIAEVVEPDASGNGHVSGANNLLTRYVYHQNSEQLMEIQQGAQRRWFAFDHLGRMTRQKLAEQAATLNDAGQFVGNGGGGARWSGAVFYDNRSNVTRGVDARGVKTNYHYNNDPFNRLQMVSYDKSGADGTYPIADSSTVYLEYMTSGDKTRVTKVNTGLVVEENTYGDAEGRLTQHTKLPYGRHSYPLVTNYLYDSLHRLKEVTYPAQYGMPSGSARKVVAPSYDEAGRLKELKVDNQIQMGDIFYNPMSQVTSVKTGAATGNADVETYEYEQTTGLLTKQKVTKANDSTQVLLNLEYYYERRGDSKGTLNGKTGQLTAIVDNKNRNRDRLYEYDALGRLSKAKGGVATGFQMPVTANWTQGYTYDRYGNRTNVQAQGTTANNQPVPTDGLPNQSYDQSSNRINTAGYEYDLAGNLTRGQDSAGNWQRYDYDTAGRLTKVWNDARNYVQQDNAYGASRQREVTWSYASANLTWYVWGGASVIAEYTGTFDANIPLSWSKSYIYAGGNSLLSTYTKNNSGGETQEFHHPDRLGTKLVTNNQANSAFEQSTLPFGTALDAEAVGTNTTNQRFTSYDRSQVASLDYAVNRSYGPAQGRFTQVDPIGMNAASLSNPQTLNMYAYCGNDPINNTDHDGLFFGKLFRAIGGFLKRAWKWVAVAAVVAIMVVATHGAGSAFLYKLGGWLAKAGIAHFVEGGGLVLGSTGIGMIAFAGVGAIVSNFAQGKRRQDDDYDEVTIFLNVRFLEIIRRNNQSVIPDEMVFCQIAIEGHQPGAPINTANSNIQPPNSPSHRGLLQISPEAAGRAGLGNGQNASIGNRTDEAVRAVNPDYIDNIYKVGTNIRIGTRYLQIRIDENKGSIDKGLEGYRKGVGSPEGRFYVKRIRSCADKVKSGDIEGGLRVIYPKGAIFGRGR